MTVALLTGSCRTRARKENHIQTVRDILNTILSFLYRNYPAVAAAVTANISVGLWEKAAALLAAARRKT